jgi:hypothetical protein
MRLVQAERGRERSDPAPRGAICEQWRFDGLFLEERTGPRSEGIPRGHRPAFRELNKRTHLRPDTVITDPAEIESFANETIGALLEIFDVTQDVRAKIISRIEAHLHEAIWEMGQQVPQVSRQSSRHR